MYIVYVLSSIKYPNRIYIGFTQDINLRLQDHNNRKSLYSKKYAPWQIETYIVFKAKEKAKRFEKYLKKGSGHAFLKNRLI
ncbi:MAG: GIY-YIG nuclease family protein [Candidatus Omnitrophota bacterium]